MITVPELSAEALGSYLTSHLGRRFSSTEAEVAELVPSVARLALECIGNSDALYHNVEHTMLVTLVGYDIMKGRALLTPTSPVDFAHVLVDCLLHDIRFDSPRLPIYTSATGCLEGDPSRLRRSLADQISLPVRWHSIVADMVSSGVQQLLEVGAGRFLYSLMKRVERSPAAFTVGFVEREGGKIVWLSKHQATFSSARPSLTH